MAEGVFGRSDAEIDLLVRGKRSGIAVVGFGYIGTVIGAVLADRGWPVTGIDVRQSIVDEINLGKTTVPEPGLNELVSNNVRVGRLRATTDFGAIDENDFIIVTVGTPLGPDFEPIVDDIWSPHCWTAETPSQSSTSQRTTATPLLTLTGMPTSGSYKATSPIWPHSNKP